MAALIDVYLTFAGKTALLKSVDETTLRRSSKVARAQLENIPTSANFTRVYIVGTSPGPLRWVLDKARKFGTRLHVRVGDRKFPETIMLYEALEALQIEPAQPQVYKHLKGYISHAKMGPADMISAHQAFGHLGADSELWRMLVHHLAWDFVHKRVTQEEGEALVKECEKYPTLNAAVLTKMDSFEKREAAKAEREAKKEAGKARKKALAEDRKRIAESNRRVREYKENRRWEETHGLREASKETVDYVMQRKVCYKVIDRTNKPAEDDTDNALTEQNEMGGEKIDEVEN